MKYLSIDIEATGLNENDLIIEFAAIPVDSQNFSCANELAFHSYIKCPSFEELEPTLNDWVKVHNKSLIDKAHQQGLALHDFHNELTKYLTNEKITSYFANQPIMILGKSINAIDLPFLNRDLGFDYMRKYFAHRTLDVTSVTMAKIDEGKIPAECLSGSKLMAHFNMGDVSHTALEDAINTAKLYFKLIKL